MQRAIKFPDKNYNRFPSYCHHCLPNKKLPKVDGSRSTAGEIEPLTILVIVMVWIGSNDLSFEMFAIFYMKADGEVKKE
jgi:hypothetical protein